jgi:hypothetical protein
VDFYAVKWFFFMVILLFAWGEGLIYHTPLYTGRQHGVRSITTAAKALCDDVCSSSLSFRGCCHVDSM